MATTLASILALQQEAGPRRDVGSWTQSRGTVQGQCFIHSPNGNIAYDSLIQLQYYSNLLENNKSENGNGSARVKDEDAEAIRNPGAQAQT